MSVGARFVALSFVTVALSGCAPAASPYTRVSPPPGVERSPRVQHQGYVFYRVHDRWYVQNRGGAWFVYEPPREPQNLWMWRR